MALTPAALARLEPAERLAFLAAASAIGRDENPGINTTVVLLLTVERLVSETPPGLVAQLRHLHRPYRIYSPCTHPERDDDGHLDLELDDGDLTCEASYLYSICKACCMVEDERGEWCSDSHDHQRGEPVCDTRALLDALPPLASPAVDVAEGGCEALPLPGQPHDGPVRRYVRICPVGHFRRGRSCQACAGIGAIVCAECPGRQPALLIPAEVWERISDDQDGQLTAEGAGLLLDPDCRDGKCDSCVGPPCEHRCHRAATSPASVDRAGGLSVRGDMPNLRLGGPGSSPGTRSKR